jgi:predicted membrane metal-binding protein
MTPPHVQPARYDTAVTLRLIANPLWIIAVGIAWSFGMTASVMAVAHAFMNGFAGLQ